MAVVEEGREKQIVRRYNIIKLSMNYQDILVYLYNILYFCKFNHVGDYILIFRM